MTKKWDLRNYHSWEKEIAYLYGSDMRIVVDGEGYTGLLVCRDHPLRVGEMVGISPGSTKWLSREKAGVGAFRCHDTVR
ncbi:hypothetical protein E2C01_045367 [Portunus trituberculatus]|uniref:Uncharacterized protein n=1 Tax=Portunus trituberculatus TaxID=210409 RepID=A0A5B7G1V8_PORTR|nr:hypothetical protein [Portunus trituberculatus]